MKDIKVLIVDDDDDDYFLITEHLKDINDHNFNILWASTYDQGVKQIINEPFDILGFTAFITCGSPCPAKFASTRKVPACLWPIAAPV